MGLFDKLGFGGTKEEKDLRVAKSLGKKVTEKFGPPENRQGAIEELGAMRTEAAIDALLARFTIRIDPGITDDEEKHRVLDLVVAAGKVSLEPIKRFLAARDEITWPLEALGELLTEQELIQILCGALNRAAVEYSRTSEKKVLLLHALSHHRSPDAVPAALPFLDDMDDDVRIAAAQVLCGQLQPLPEGASAEETAIAATASTAAQEKGRVPLLETFLKAHEQHNARVREALAGLLADSPLDVKGYTPKFEAALPEAYKLDSKGKIQRA